MNEETVGFMQPIGIEMTDGTLTTSQDQMLKEQYPANVEGSPEVNEANSEAVQEDLKKQIEEMLSNPSVRANALVNAQDIKKKCKGWFTIEVLAKKLLLEPKVVLDILQVLILFEFAYRKADSGVMKYKIQFSNEDKIKILQEELKEAEDEVAKIKRKIEQISNQ